MDGLEVLVTPRAGAQSFPWSHGGASDQTSRSGAPLPGLYRYRTVLMLRVLLHAGVRWRARDARAAEDHDPDDRRRAPQAATALGCTGHGWPGHTRALVPPLLYAPSV